MDKIPSLIPNIVFIGDVNAGKSSLINLITKQQVSIVSEYEGTTTDEVVKRFELLNYGPINIIDTAGLQDQTTLGSLRLEKTNKAIDNASMIVYVQDSTKEFDLTYYNNLKTNKILVFTKTDLLKQANISDLTNSYPEALLINNLNDSANLLLDRLLKNLKPQQEKLLEKIKLINNKIVHVIPIDEAAPAGRIILPQMQLIRECLDDNITSIIVNETTLEQALNDNIDIDLIVTDSKIFNYVSMINNDRYKLTSYSILQANLKGDLAYFKQSLDKLKDLDYTAKILIMESCSHNISHDDIGQKVIPKILYKLIDSRIKIDFKMSKDFSDIEQYDFIVHCGSCMLNKDIMQNRIDKAKLYNIPMTNYGLLLAYESGILKQAISVYNLK